MTLIKNAIAQLMDSGEQRRCKQCLNLLSYACETKAEAMNYELNNSLKNELNSEFPIVYIIDNRSFVTVVKNDSLYKLSEEVKEAFKGMVENDLIETEIITNFLIAEILSNTNDIVRKQLFVGVDNSALIRYDMYYCVRDIDIEDLKKIADKSITCILSKSKIEARNRLNFPPFLKAYKSQLEKIGMTQDQITAEMEKTRQFYINY